MAIRNVREMGDPVLNKICKEVKEMTPRTLELIDDMFDTMYEGAAKLFCGSLKTFSETGFCRSRSAIAAAMGT